MLLKIILYVLSVEVGTLMCEILERAEINVWIARSFGVLVAVLVALFFYKLWINKN